MVLCSSFLTSWELSPCRPSAMGKSLSLKRFCRWAPRADRLRHSSAPQAQRWRAACGAGHLRIVPIKHVKHCETYVKVRSFWMSKGNPNKHLRQTHIYIYSREGDTKEVLWRTLRSHPTLHARKKKKHGKAMIFATRFMTHPQQLTLGALKHQLVAAVKPLKGSHRGPSFPSLYEKKHILETIDQLLKWYCFYNVSPCHIFIWDNSLFSLLVFWWASFVNY